MLSKYKKIKHISGKKYISKRRDWNGVLAQGMQWAL